MAGSEVFDDVAFYYVATSFIGCIAILCTFVIIFNLFSEWINSEGKTNSSAKKIAQQRKETIGSKKLLRPTGTEPPPASRWLKKRYFFLIVVWIVFIKLISLRSTYGNQSFASFEPYEILGLDYGASEALVRKAYRKMSMKWHPDQHTHSPTDLQQEAEEKFLLITKAYYSLTDPKTRDNYERYGNPDGANQGSTSMTYGLPTFLSNKKFEIYVLIGYLILFVSLPLGVFYKFFSGSSATFEGTGVANETVQWFVGEMGPDMEAKNLIEITSLSMEFRKQFSSTNPTKERLDALKTLFQQCKNMAPHKHSKIFYIMYGSVLFHCYLQRIQIPTECSADLRFYLEQVPKLHSLLAEISRQNRGLKPFMGALDLLQCAIQRVWVDDKENVFHQFLSPTFNTIHAEKLIKKNIKTLYQLRVASRESIIKLLGFSENDYDALMQQVSLLPQVKLEATVTVNNTIVARPQDILTIDYSFQRMFDAPFQNPIAVEYFPPKGVVATPSTSKTLVEQKPGQLVNPKDKAALREERLEAKRQDILDKIDNWEVYIEKQKTSTHSSEEVPDVVSNSYPYPKKEVWYLALIWFHNGKQFLVDSRVIKNFSESDEPLTGKMLIQLPANHGSTKYELHLRCDSYLGCDVVKSIQVQIVDPNSKKDLVEKVAKDSTLVDEVDVDTGVVTKRKLVGPDDIETIDQGESDAEDEDLDDDALFEDELEDNEEEPETYWYYLGGSSLWEALANVLFMSILGFVVYHYCNQMAWWKNFVTPNLHKLWTLVQPYTEKVSDLVLPHIEPIYYKLENFLHWFLGDQAEMPIHIKLEKAFSSRGRIF